MYNDTLTSDDLKAYASDVFSGHVIMPVALAEFALDLDVYLSLPEAEKINDFRFYGKIKKLEDNFYLIDDGRTVCSVKTGGKSLWEADAKWEFLSFSTTSWLLTHGKIYCNVSSGVVLESYPGDEGSIRLFSMIYGDDPVGMELMEIDDEGRCRWNIGSTGRVIDTDGYWSEYMTGSEGISVVNRYNEAYKADEYICGGEFLVNIYRNDEPLDWCKAVFTPGYDTDFKTSR